MRLSMFAALMLAVCSPHAVATTYFVRTSGSDRSAGTSAAAAYRTVSKAMTVAGPGDTVYVGAGTYTETFPTIRSGASGSPVQYTADIGGTNTGDAGTVTLTDFTGAVLAFTGNSYVTFNNIIISGGTYPVQLTTCTQFTFNSCTLQSGSSGGLSISGSSVTLSSTDIKNGSGYGITAASGSGLTMNAGTISGMGSYAVYSSGSSTTMTISGVSIINTNSGVYVGAGTASVVNCLIYSVSTGIYAAGGTTAAWQNTIANTTFAVIVGGTATVRNNIMTASSYGILNVGALTHGTNLYYNNGTNYFWTTAGTGDVYTNPSFVSSTDYHLNAGSGAVNTGAVASSVSSLDKDGYSRPCGGGWDIGCYERGNCGSKPKLKNWTTVAPQ